ncbi:MAG: outer membrane protein assembly factor BamD [Alphaproteobacteria bacterium]
MKHHATSMKRALASITAVLALTLFLGACESTSKDKDYVEGTVDELYNIGMDHLLEERYERAAKYFDEVERQHPYSVWATRAQLMAGYAHYLDNKYIEAINTLERFIQLHPGNRNIAYAYYLRALSYYEQILEVTRDQSSATRALKSMEELLRRFPNSEYARDVRRKIDLTRDHLAGKEMEVGRFYLKRSQYLAAINRFRRVIDEYQTTTHVPEALHRLVEAYLALGVVDEARKAAAVLGHNYPGSKWYIDSYELVEGVEVQTGSPDETEAKDGSVWDWMF